MLPVEGVRITVKHNLDAVLRLITLVRTELAYLHRLAVQAYKGLALQLTNIVSRLVFLRHRARRFSGGLFCLWRCLRHRSRCFSTGFSLHLGGVLAVAHRALPHAGL